MIQRIQSILLFIAAALVLALYLVPFGSTREAITASGLFSDQVFNIHDHITLLIFFSIAGILALIGIFMFNNRPLQLKLSIFSVIANVLGIIMGVVLFMQDSANLGAIVPTEEYGLGFPVLSIVFALFAMRYIRKDENLVRSMDRLR